MIDTPLNKRALRIEESSRLKSGECCEVLITCDHRNALHPRITEIVDEYKDRVLSDGKTPLVVGLVFVDQEGRPCDVWGDAA